MTEETEKVEQPIDNSKMINSEKQSEDKKIAHEERMASKTIGYSYSTSQLTTYLGEIHYFASDGEPEGVFLGPKPERTIESMIAKSLKTVKSIHEQELISMSGDYSQAERETWNLQLEWSSKYMTDQDEESRGYLTDMVPAEELRQMRNMDIDPASEVAKNILTKAAINKKLVVLCARMKSEADQAFSSCTTEAQIDALTVVLKDKMEATRVEFRQWVHDLLNQ